MPARLPHSKAPSRRLARTPRTTDTDARERILDAAEKLFAGHGFDGTATSAIAVAADVPKGLVFYYFPTKESILTALVGERLPQDPLSDVGDLVSPGDPARSLVNLENALNLRDHHSQVMRVIIWREAETHPDVRENLARLRAYLHSATERLLAASTPATIQPGTLRACATAWVSAMFAAATTDRLRALDGNAPGDDLASVARVLAAGMVQLG